MLLFSPLSDPCSLLCIHYPLPELVHLGNMLPKWGDNVLWDREWIRMWIGMEAGHHPQLPVAFINTPLVEVDIST